MRPVWEKEKERSNFGRLGKIQFLYQVSRACSSYLFMLVCLLDVSSLKLAAFLFVRSLPVTVRHSTIYTLFFISSIDNLPSPIQFFDKLLLNFLRKWSLSIERLHHD